MVWFIDRPGSVSLPPLSFLRSVTLFSVTAPFNECYLFLRNNFISYIQVSNSDFGV